MMALPDQKSVDMAQRAGILSRKEYSRRAGKYGMQIMDILGGPQSGAAAANLARAFNIEPKAAEAALGALVPALGDRIERNTLSRGGLADLVSMLGQGDRRPISTTRKRSARPRCWPTATTSSRRSSAPRT